jgi:pimeloyl-ACP methyl ester carboxylesterase
MTVRNRGRDVAADRDSLAAAFVGASGRVTVFVHGLGQTEDAWDPAGSERVPYPARLRSELGYTPVMVRYNTGRSIDENGTELARLLGQVIDAWPVPVHELALIGHATGALVARSACYAAFEQPWAAKLRHVITLGAPHRGSFLEKAVQTATRALSTLPETRAAGKTLELRSAGLKDAGRGSETPFLPHVRHLFVSASVMRDPDSRLGRAFGDLLVSRNSAWAHPGDRRPMRFPVESYRHVGGINHFDLLDHPVVLGQIVDWLRRPELPSATT